MILELAVVLLELHGRIEPPRPAQVTLEGAYKPFSAITRAGVDGRFRFRKLAPGTYTLAVTDVTGEARRTVEVTEKFAGRKGRVSVVVHFEPGTGGGAAEVSVRQLAVPREAQKAYERADEKLERGDVAAAVRELERAVELAPGYAAAWNHLGTIAYQTGRYPDAEKYFRRALEADPGEYSPLVNLGGVLLNLNRPREALEYNRRAADERPDDALAVSQLGLSFYMLGNYEQAEKYLTTAKRLDPAHFSQPQLALADIYLRRGDRTGALRELEDFLKQHPDAPNAAQIRDGIEKLKKP